LVDLVPDCDRLLHMARPIQVQRLCNKPCAVNDEGTLSRYDLDESC
jgi:hypothetical protein